MNRALCLLFTLLHVVLPLVHEANSELDEM